MEAEKEHTTAVQEDFVGLRSELQATEDAEGTSTVLCGSDGMLHTFSGYVCTHSTLNNHKTTLKTTQCSSTEW